MTKNYPSNLTWEQWEQWELIAEMFPEAKPGGRPRTTTCMYAVVRFDTYCVKDVHGGHYQEIYHLVLQSMDISEDGAKTVLGFRFVHDKLYEWVRVAASRNQVYRKQPLIANQLKPQP